MSNLPNLHQIYPEVPSILSENIMFECILVYIRIILNGFWGMFGVLLGIMGVLWVMLEELRGMLRVLWHKFNLIVFWCK